MSLFWRLCVDVYRRFDDDDDLTLAGNIAFCAILALFPFLIFLTTLAGFFGDPQLAQAVVDSLLAIMPEQLVATLESDIHDIMTVPRGGLLTISIVFTLYAAQTGVESVRTGLNRAYRTGETRIWAFRFVQNLLFVIAGALVLLALAVLIVFVPVYWSKLEIWMAWTPDLSRWLHLLRIPASLTLLFTALAAAHMYLPARRLPMRAILPGVLATIVLWLAAAWIYAGYLRTFSGMKIMYASLANVIIALIFLYILAAVMILGAQINQAIISRRDKPQAPQASTTSS